MNQFKGSIATLEAAINHLMNYLAEIEGVPHPLHVVEARVLVLVIAIGLSALVHYVAGVGFGDVGPVHMSAECHKRRRIGVRRRTYRSLFGNLPIRRTYYYSSAHGGFSPLDAQLALPARSYSYHIQKHIWLLDAQNAYAEGSSTLLKLVGVHVPKSMGQLMLAEAAEAVPDFLTSAPAPKDEGELLVLMPDAKGVNMVRPVEKAPPGSKLAPRPVERQGKKKMANAWAIYTMNPNSGCPPEPINRTTHAFLGTKREAFEMLAADAKRRGFGTKKALFLADGDPAQWALKKEFFPDALECLDIMHLLDYVWNAAHVFHPKGSVAAKAWVDKQYDLLMQDNSAAVIGDLKQSATTEAASLTEAQRETLATVIGYMENNKDRMPYGSFMLAGYPIGTGSIEGGVRHLIGDRMERTGMRWTEQGAQAMLHMRAIHINGQMADFHEHRIRREQERLYGAESRFLVESCG